jgi:exopolyphosphatase/guanosine-5'-triphosphate,3'-diphosphate pyrophosphatase
MIALLFLLSVQKDGRNKRMRVGIIDLGTHNALLMIVDVSGSTFTVIRQEQRIVALGKGIELTGSIQEEAIDRAIEALKEYREITTRLDVVKTKLAATAVLRDPKNADYVCRRLEKETGFVPQIITGEEEARFVYLAGCRAFPNPAKKVVIDIGGGSIEFVCGEGNAIKLKKSLSIGAVKMTERFITTFPIIDTELNNLRKHLFGTYKNELSDFFAHSPERFIGVAGTFTTAAAMVQSLVNYDPAKITGFQLEKRAVSELLNRVTHMTIDEQKAIPGLHPKRAGFIVTGLVLIESFYDFFNIEIITVSDEGLRFGLLIDWILNKS